MAKMFRHVFGVRSRYPFPVDMLRYDAAYPRRGEDAVVITNNIREQGLSDLWEVELEHIGHRTWAPTTARWESMGAIIMFYKIQGEYN